MKSTQNTPTTAQAWRLAVVADEWAPLEPLLTWLHARPEVGLLDRYEQTETPPSFEGCYAVVMYIHSALREDAAARMIAYTKAGGRLIVLHHGIASAKVRTPSWMDFLGMRIAPRDDPKAPWRVIANTRHTLVNLNPKHFLTSHEVEYDGVTTYRSSDTPTLSGEFPALFFENTETFLNQQFTDGHAKTVLFGVKCTDPATGAVFMQDRGGWLKQCGRGYAFYLQTGHCATDCAKPQYRQIVLNFLLWQP